MCCQAGHLPPLNADDANMFSTSEHIIQDHVRKYKTKAAELKDLIEAVLHHPDFDVREVDTNMGGASHGMSLWQKLSRGARNKRGMLDDGQRRR
jgi:hypothetical protein